MPNLGCEDDKMKKLIALICILKALTAITVYAAVTSKSPTGCTGSWTTCSNAFANDANRATATATATTNVTGSWKNYTHSFTNGDVITNVTVRADFFASNVRGFLAVRVSSNGGQTFGPVHIVGGNTAEQRFLIDVTGDRSWNVSSVNNSNLVVNATCIKQGSGSNPAFRLDWIPVNVTYTPDALPFANITVNTTSGSEPLDVAFTGIASGGNAPLTFLWNFKDGSNATTQNVTHSFNSGVYNVTFTVTDDDGDSAIVGKVISVSNDAPVADAIAN